MPWGFVFGSLDTVPGDLVEVGVGGGDSALVLCGSRGSRLLYCYDTFGEFPLETASEFESADCLRSLGMCSSPLVLEKLDRQGVVCVKGIFPVTFWMDRPAVVSLVPLDVDTYVGTKSGLDLFSPLMSRGGFFAVHDWTNGRLHGVKSAVNKFLSENGS